MCGCDDVRDSQPCQGGRAAAAKDKHGEIALVQAACKGHAEVA